MSRIYLFASLLQGFRLLDTVLVPMVSRAAKRSPRRIGVLGVKLSERGLGFLDWVPHSYTAY